MNTMDILSNLPDHSRVWIYTSDREFTKEEQSKIQETGNAFTQAWKVHGTAMEAGFAIMYNRFLILSVNEKVAGASGCSIDSSVGFMKNIETEFKVSVLDKLLLAYHSENNKIEVLPMFEFQKEMDNGGIHSQTMVFNNLVETLGDLRNSWEVTLENSWHKQLL